MDNFTYGNQMLQFPFSVTRTISLFMVTVKPKDLCRIVDDIDAVIILFGLVGDPITKYPQLSERVNIKDIKFAIDFWMIKTFKI